MGNLISQKCNFGIEWEEPLEQEEDKDNCESRFHDLELKLEDLEQKLADVKIGVQEESTQKDHVIENLAKIVKQDANVIIEMENEQRISRIKSVPWTLRYQNDRSDCKYCNFQAKTHDILLKHVQEQHNIKEYLGNINGIRCHLCGWSFKNMDKVKHHMKQFHQINELDDIKVHETEIETLIKNNFSGIFKCNQCLFENKVSIVHIKISTNNLNQNKLSYVTRFQILVGKTGRPLTPV